MPAINESAFKDIIKNNPVGIFLIYGEEGYLKKAYAEKIISKTVDDAFADFNFHSDSPPYHKLVSVTFLLIALDAFRNNRLTSELKSPIAVEYE